jgi:phosphatidyl-myo-inositol dimannoside synthase
MIYVSPRSWRSCHDPARRCCGRRSPGICPAVHLTSRALLLTPSRGRGGGIERYVETLEWAFTDQGVEYRRIDLLRPGAGAHARLLGEGRNHLRASAAPTRLVVAHRALLPVASLLARERSVRGISVVCHGSDVWATRPRVRRRVENRLLRRPSVRVVAVSSYTAGALASGGPACVLPPALSGRWFRTLVSASECVQPSGSRLQLLTAFRLADWRAKGLPELLAALASLGRPDLCLTICGNGEPPPDLVDLIRTYPWCVLKARLSDRELAAQFAAADLFVLATRTKPGRRACGEGFGLVLLEAQVAGTPVVGPAYGGAHDAYLDGVTGVAPVDESAAALAKTLAELLSDPRRLSRMGRRAAEWARECCDSEIYPPRAVSRLL